MVSARAVSELELLVPAVVWAREDMVSVVDWASVLALHTKHRCLLDKHSGC